MHGESTPLIWSYDIRHGAASAAHAAVLLAAFSLTIIVLMMSSAGMRRDRLSHYFVRPFLLAFFGNLLCAFQFMVVETDVRLAVRTFALMMPPELMMVVSSSFMLFAISLAILWRHRENLVRLLDHREPRF